MAAHTEFNIGGVAISPNTLAQGLERKRTGNVLPLGIFCKSQIASDNSHDQWPPAPRWKLSSQSSYLPKEMPADQKLERMYAGEALKAAWRSTDAFFKNEQYFAGEPLDRIEKKMRGLEIALEKQGISVPSVQVVLKEGTPKVLAIGRSFVKVYGKTT